MTQQVSDLTDEEIFEIMGDRWKSMTNSLRRILHRMETTNCCKWQYPNCRSVLERYILKHDLWKTSN